MKFGAATTLITGLLFVSLAFPGSIHAAACDAVYPASVVNGENFTVRVELPIPSNVSTDQLAVCPQDSINPLNIDGNDPVGRYCFRFSACNTGVSGAGGCNTGIGSSWFTPASGGVLSSDGRFLELNMTAAVSTTFKLEANNLLISSNNANGSTRFNACANEWRVTVSGGTATCDAGTFTFTGPEGTLRNPLTINYDSSKTHNFFRGTYAVYIRSLGGTEYFPVATLSDSLGGGSLPMSGVGQGVTQNGTIYSLSLESVHSSPLAPGNWEIVIQDQLGTATYCRFPFSVDADSVITPPTNETNTVQAAFALCQQATNAEERDACEACVGGSTITDPNSQHFWTAFGCVRTSKEGLIQDFLRIGLGLAGGFVLLSILYGSFLLTTSSGDPKRVQEGQEMISSAIMGLLFVIFSVVILQFIGVSILRIPGFGG